MKVLITSGGTEEAIDGVRSLSNFSTGKTGSIIADFLSDKKIDIILLKGKRAVSPKNKIRIIDFLSFNDLNTKIKNLLNSESFDAVIHLAAVSDFSLDYIESGGTIIEDTGGKLDSSKPLNIHLKPNFKILDRLKTYSKSNILIIGFKLTKNINQTKINKKISDMFKKKTIDIIVHNDYANITDITHHANIFYKNKLIVKTETKEELAEELYNIIMEKLNGTMS